MIVGHDIVIILRNDFKQLKQKFMEKQELELRLMKAIETERLNDDKQDKHLRDVWAKHVETVEQIYKKLLFLKKFSGIIKIEMHNGLYNRGKAMVDQFPSVLIEGNKFTIMVGKKYRSHLMEVHSIYDNEIFAKEVQKTTYEDIIDNIAKLLI